MERLDPITSVLRSDQLTWDSSSSTMAPRITLLQYSHVHCVILPYQWIALVNSHGRHLHTRPFLLLLLQDLNNADEEAVSAGPEKGQRCSEGLGVGTMVQCAGCRRNFSASGYTSHVTRTLNEVCRAVHQNTLRHEDFDDVLSTLQQEDFINSANGDYGTWGMDSAGLHGHDDENSSSESDSISESDGIDPDDFKGKFSVGGKSFHM